MRLFENENMAGGPAASCVADNGCSRNMFDCLQHLWDWFDPQEPQSLFQMNNSKTTPATQQPITQHHMMAHHVHPDQMYAQKYPQMSAQLPSPQSSQMQTNQIPPNGVMHQLLQSQYQSNMDARSPLLENRHDVYGQNISYSRHYGANENYNYPQSPPRQERTDVHTDYNVNHDLLQNVPKGYNPEVHQDYLKRNPPKENNQIYHNHQNNMYRPNSSNLVNNGSKPYLPYSSRIGPQSNTEMLRRQYNEIQQMKLQQQMHYQNQAQMHQQQKFAERQLLLQQIHGVQPPPNLQNSIYSDGSYRDLDQYSSRNDFIEYNSADIQKEIDQYAKNNEFRDGDKINNQYQQEPQWQNQQTDYRDVERYRRQSEGDKGNQQSPPSDYNKQGQNNNVGVVSPMKSSESSSPSVKSPLESRRSSCGNQVIRSPIAQRSPSAPVTISGILYKQGSDGLKVWRKRWFVLAEYCLFYYKGQEEEKLLGSVLLPSYQVSACTSEDKVLRKYAFKLEHANMRTYVLAAPDQDSMMKWVKALTMAAIMQNSGEQQSTLNDRAAAKTDDSDEAPGPTYANAPPKPRRSNEGYNSPSPDMYDPNYDLLKQPASHYSQGTPHSRYQDQTYQTNQNTYAAGVQSPPTQQQQQHYQMKRPLDSHNLSLPLTNTTDRIDSQPSTSNGQNHQMYKNNPMNNYYDNRNRGAPPSKEQIYGRQQQQQNNPFLQEQTPEISKEAQARNFRGAMEQERAKSAMNERTPEPNAQYASEGYGENGPHVNRPVSSMNERLINERRTPDAYGRSASTAAYNRNKNGDYEDVYAYGTESEYGMSYNKTTSPPQNQIQDNINSGQQTVTNHMPQERVFAGPAVLRRKKMQSSGIQPQVPRPHSADFLEYESKNELMKSLPNKSSNITRQPPRPKSSLDINSYYDPSSDRYYSEESYAAKMRQSAQYLQQGLGTGNIQIPLAKYASGLAEKQLNSPYAQNVNNNYETEFGTTRSNRDNTTYNSKYNEAEGLNSNWVLKEKDLENQRETINRSGSVVGDVINMSQYTKEVNKADDSDRFKRSASARLHSEFEKEGEKKVQQREESMKRLLEWKQRMLQSPLTRKSTPATKSLARSLNHSRQSLRADQYKQKTYNASYNSYSSDDEEETTDTELQNSREVQAGRSQKGSSPSLNDIPPPVTPHAPPSATLVTKPVATVSTDVNITAARVEEHDYENMKFVHPAVEETSASMDTNTYENTHFLSNLVDDDAKQEDDQDGYETHESEAESETLEYTDNDLDEVLMDSDKETETSVVDSDTLKRKTEDSVQSNLNENEVPGTPPAHSGEDHYLPMSPRKASTIEPAHKTIIEHLNVFGHAMAHGHEDNPYVEMNLGNEDEDLQTYEVVCVNNGKMEPVYMELSNVTSEESNDSSASVAKSVCDTASNFADTNAHTLKRAAKGSKSKKNNDDDAFKSSDKNKSDKPSDCSDADDEASKDLSLDMPFSRFSISDTFRPASYYLGGSKTILNRLDSSDSEPPIPNTPPPSADELSQEALSKYVLDKLDQSDMSQDNSILKMLTSESQKMNTVKRKTTSLMIYGSRTSIHDTLSRGEKIRSNRASLNERSKLNDSQPVLSTSVLERYDSRRSIETDSLVSYNADRGSSRLSLESDVSSKFEMAPSHFSSEVTSLNESESALELRNIGAYRNMETMLKRRPLSEDSFFELGASSAPETNESTSQVDLDRYLSDLQPRDHRQADYINSSHQFVNTSMNASSLSSNVPPVGHVHISHSRCSSTPVAHTHSFNPHNNRHIMPFVNLSDQNSGYIGSQSSCSSVGITKSPISYYCKSYEEEKILNKNLNKEENINKVECEKIVNKPDTNASTSTTSFHSRESSTEQSAPYYYSDLSSQENINHMQTSHYLKNTNLHRKLNNQRRRITMQKKNEITHIHNPIHSDKITSAEPFELAAARSISVEFLSAADKDLDIDMKNIYASGGMHSKISESMKLIPQYTTRRNSHNETNDSSESCLNVSLNKDIDHQHSNSLVKASSTSISSPCSENSSNTVYYDAEADACAYENLMYQGDKYWEEDSLWRDNLRRVSHRHARSMDDLDNIPAIPSRRVSVDSSAMNSIKRVKKDQKITRNVTYVNYNIQEQILNRSNGNPNYNIITEAPDDKSDDNDVYVSLAETAQIVGEQSDEGVYEQLTVDSSDNSLVGPTMQSKQEVSERMRKKFEIDREKLRQWDLMSSGLMKGARGGVRVPGAVGDVLCSTDSGADSASIEASMTMPKANLDQTPTNPPNQQSLSKKPFLGSNTSIGRSNRDSNIPVRAVSPRVRWVEEKPNDHYGSQQMSMSQQNIHTLSGPEDAWTNPRSPSRASQQPIRAVSPRIRRNTDTDEMRREHAIMGDQFKSIPTAGELLGRTHEELVLLLIQLRRRHTATHRAIEQCCAQINNIEDCLGSLKAMEREESIQRLDQLKMQLMELEHQYQKSKPLVQLVDNMVKLGSLYNRPGNSMERLERNQRLRQKVLVEHAMEQQRWLESAAAGKPLETEAARARVAELWALQQELADEASIIQGIKTDKDAIESLLSGVRNKFNGLQLQEGTTGEDLEAELTRVHAMLALNSKKLEQTVAENARLERELSQLRRALHAQRQAGPATPSAPAAPTAPATPALATAMLEDEVSRVQQLVSALQRQRQELSRAVRHLTQQSRVLQTTHSSLPGKRPRASWQETNLDTGHTDAIQSDYDYEQSALVPPGHYDRNVEMPLYVDTRVNGQDVTSPITSDDVQQNSAFANLSNVEKQEIKTVRIVKRESERRQRDRERSFQPMSDWPAATITANLDHFLEEEFQPYQRASSVPRTDFSKFEEYYSKPQDNYAKYGKDMHSNMELSPKFPSSPSLSNYDYSRDISSLTNSYNISYDPSTYSRNLSNSTQYLNSPTESSRTLTNGPLSKTSSIGSLTRSHMELSPIFKSEAAKQIITEMSGDSVKNGSLHRRQVPKEKRRHNTAPHHLSAKTLNEMPKDAFNQDKSCRSLDDADMERLLRAPPDVVRSALPSTASQPPSAAIDRLLAAPQKIRIPERYIPEQPPELSPEEQQKRQEKVESIKKMLSSSSIDPNKSPDTEDKKQREHLLQMNQILAKQVTEMSKIIAVKALEELPDEDPYDYDDRSPDVELPIYQQRDNFFT